MAKATKKKTPKKKPTEKTYRTILAEKVPGSIPGLPAEFGFVLKGDETGTSIILEHTANEPISVGTLVRSFVGVAYQLNKTHARAAIQNAETQIAELSGETGADMSQVVKDFIEKLKSQGIKVHAFGV